MRLQISQSLESLKTYIENPTIEEKENNSLALSKYSRNKRPPPKKTASPPAKKTKPVFQKNHIISNSEDSQTQDTPTPATSPVPHSFNFGRPRPAASQLASNDDNILPDLEDLSDNSEFEGPLHKARPPHMARKSVPGHGPQLKSSTKNQPAPAVPGPSGNLQLAPYNTSMSSPTLGAPAPLVRQHQQTPAATSSPATAVANIHQQQNDFQHQMAQMFSSATFQNYTINFKM